LVLYGLNKLVTYPPSDELPYYIGEVQNSVIPLLQQASCLSGE